MWWQATQSIFSFSLFSLFLSSLVLYPFSSILFIIYYLFIYYLFIYLLFIYLLFIYYYLFLGYHHSHRIRNEVHTHVCPPIRAKSLFKGPLSLSLSPPPPPLLSSPLPPSSLSYPLLLSLRLSSATPPTLPSSQALLLSFMSTRLFLWLI